MLPQRPHFPLIILVTGEQIRKKAFVMHKDVTFSVCCCCVMQLNGRVHSKLAVKCWSNSSGYFLFYILFYLDKLALNFFNMTF